MAENAAPAWKDGRGWRFAPAPSAIIGESEGAPEYPLGHVAGALILSDTLVVVGDRGSAQIRYFSPRGIHLRTLGRTGDGPGEFRRIDWIGARGDTVVVWDSFAARATLLKPDGTVARTVPVPAAAGDVYPSLGLLGDGG
ncbi:MAG TPA: hypothetical protein VEX86_06290 [Longimicrobium sp.]|nr:hypothetical protein [Longimicrobium sp.]